MQLTTALLCDFAQVRERLLFISSGGLTRVHRPELPAQLDIYLALMIQMDQIEAADPHRLEVELIDVDGRPLALTTGDFHAQEWDLQLAENLQFPMVLDLRAVAVEQWGAHDLHLRLDGDHHGIVTFYVTGTDSP